MPVTSAFFTEHTVLGRRLLRRKCLFSARLKLKQRFFGSDIFVIFAIFCAKIFRHRTKERSEQKNAKITKDPMENGAQRLCVARQALPWASINSILFRTCICFPLLAASGM
jgi:hypothetical protein